jgi:two-component system, chemotaxis family, response regulator Rcp1
MEDQMSGRADGAKTQILVIEDNPADVEILRYALDNAKVDCELIIIADGGEALAFFERSGKSPHDGAPDLAILDLNLPRYDGIELLEAMRANSAFDAVPVAVLSSSSSPRDRAKIEAFGITRYITKPPDLEEYMRIGKIVKQILEETQAPGNSV